MSDDFQSHELITATKLNRVLRAGRCIGRARRVTNSSAANSPALVPVLELDDIPIINGRCYTIQSSPLFMDTSVANDVGQAWLTYTTDGSTPVIGSTLLPGGVVEAKLVDASFGESRVISTTFTASADGSLSLLLSVARGSGTGNIVIQANGTSTLCEIRVYDSGEDPGDTGVDL